MQANSWSVVTHVPSQVLLCLFIFSVQRRFLLSSESESLIRFRVSGSGGELEPFDELRRYAPGRITVEPCAHRDEFYIPGGNSGSGRNCCR